MSAVKRLMVLDEGQVVARVDKHLLPDLDEVLLEMYSEIVKDPHGQMYWLADEQEEDHPTRITSSTWALEARVNHRRISPCFCGDHGWHLDSVHEDESGMPDRPDGRGAFLAVVFE